jgi:hypothetical protein
MTNKIRTTEVDSEVTRTNHSLPATVLYFLSMHIGDWGNFTVVVPDMGVKVAMRG